jgi:hypothetical protein
MDDACPATLGNAPKSRTLRALVGERARWRSLWCEQGEWTNKLSEVLKRLCDVMVLREHFSWRAEEIRREILRPQNQKNCPSQKKAAQRDATTETVLKSSLRKMQQISK